MFETTSHPRAPAATLEQTLRQALASHQAGKLREAEQLYKTVIAQQPAHATANHNLGILAVQLQRPEAGLPYFRAALDANPAQEQYRISYSKALLDSGKPKDALKILNIGRQGRLTSPVAEALRQQIEQAYTRKRVAATPALDAEIDRIVVLFNAGYYEEAEKKSQSLLVEHPDSGLAWKTLGAAQKAQHKDALTALRKSAELLPDDAEAHYNLGVALEDLGQLPEAEVSYRQALAVKPDFAKAHYNLGLTLNDSGRYEEAAQSYRKALEIKADFADVYNNLGATLAALGDIEEAIASYRQGLQIRPGFAEAHNNLGNMLMAQGKHIDAIACYRNALGIKHNFAEAHRNLGNALKETGKFLEAAASYRRALDFQPATVELLLSIGLALKDSGNVDEIAVNFRRALDLDPECAEAHLNLAMTIKNADRHGAAYHCHRALEIDPALVSAILFKAEILSDKGHFDLAEQAVYRAIAIEPDSAPAWARLASLRKMTVNDGGWLAAAERIANTELSAHDEASLRFALGKYYDDTKNFDQAFANYQRANELLKTFEARYDQDAQNKLVELTKQLYGREWITRLHPYANPSKRPVFIVGMPRSGTSLAEQILASHPDVYGAGELTFWNSVGRTHPLSELTTDKAAPILAKLGGDYLRVLNEFSSDALHVIDKMPSNFIHLGLIHTIYPNCRIIHMQRNPIDTCLSIYFQFLNSTHAYAYDLEDLAHCYREYRRVMAHWRDVLPVGTMLEVPYEALTGDQEGWTRKMLEFLELSWDERCLDFDKKERVVGTFSNWQVRQKITKNSVERWRNYEKYVGPLLGLLSDT